jgi:hypothetical protein
MYVGPTWSELMADRADTYDAILKTNNDALGRRLESTMNQEQKFSQNVIETHRDITTSKNNYATMTERWDSFRKSAAPPYLVRGGQKVGLGPRKSMMQALIAAMYTVDRKFHSTFSGDRTDARNIENSNQVAETDLYVFTDRYDQIISKWWEHLAVVAQFGLKCARYTPAISGAHSAVLVYEMPFVSTSCPGTSRRRILTTCLGCQQRMARAHRG